MKLTLTIDLEHVDGTGRDDPERVTDIGYWQLLDSKVVHAGNHGEAQYKVTGYSFGDGEPERGEDGESLDELPET